MYVVVQNVPYFNETKPNTNECSKSELKSLIKPTICSPHANKLLWMPRVPGLRVQVVTVDPAVTRRDSSVMCHTDQRYSYSVTVARHYSRRPTLPLHTWSQQLHTVDNPKSI